VQERAARVRVRPSFGVVDVHRGFGESHILCEGEEERFDMLTSCSAGQWLFFYWVRHLVLVGIGT
jgi:hypothetical protein